jgi:hypothetical protein
MSVSETAPVPHPDFSVHLFIHGPKSGVCGVGAISRPVVGATDVAAGELPLQRFDALRRELKAAFGEPTSVRRPRQLSLADLQAQKSDIGADWVFEGAPGSTLNRPIASISVWALPKPPTTSMLRIIFRFSNASAAFRAGSSNNCQ